MKNIYTVICEHTIENGKEKNYAYVMPFMVGTELNHQFKLFKDNIIHLCETKKQARELAHFWNKCYKDNGTYMY